MNYIAIIAAAVVNMVVGFVWYMPKVFGNSWMKSIGVTKDDINKNKDKMPMMYGLMFAGALVTAYVLDRFIVMMGITDAFEGATLAFWAWVGFMAPIFLTLVLFENRKMKWFAIAGGYQLVVMLINGALLASWR